MRASSHLGSIERRRYSVIRKGSKYWIIDLVKVRLANLRRRIFAWSKVIEPMARVAGVKMVMYRLSYDSRGTLVDASEWAALDISEFMQRLRARMGRRLLAYAWVAELQQRGVIHYHVCIVYRGYAPMPDRAYRNKDGRGHWRAFNRMWWKGTAHTEFNVRSPYYMASYCKKEYQKDYMHFPRGAHAWAVWVSDSALKLALKIDSLDEFKRGRVCELKLSGDGMGWEDAYESMKEEQAWMVIGNRIRWKWGEDVAEYCGSVVSAAGLAQWGIFNVSDADLSKKMVTVIESGCAGDPLVAVEASE